MRLNQYVARHGFGARRAIDTMISAGRIAVNDIIITQLGYKIDPTKDSVTIDGTNRIEPQSITKLVYILFNKPRGVVTTAKDELGRKTVLDCVKVSERIVPVGRLDRDTTGVLLLTNDGDLHNKLIHPSQEVTKEYVVLLNRDLTPQDRTTLEQGILLEEGMTRPCEITPDPNNPMRATIILHEGKKRQIRRMLESLEYSVRTLDRVSFAGLTYTGLTEGKWRHLTSQEVVELKKKSS